MAKDHLRAAWILGGDGAAEACMRLFCLPYAGGSAAVFRDWERVLGPDFDVRPVQLPGRASRFGEPAFERLAPLVDELARHLRPYLDMPYALFGHSMGALVAFELARTLRASGSPAPAHLIVSGHPAPRHADDEPPVHELAEPELLEALDELASPAGAHLADDELRRLMLPIIRADFAVCETYVYEDGELLDVPITAMGGHADGKVGRRALRDWKRETSAPFALHMLAGGHFFIDEAPADVLDIVRGALSAQLVGERIDADA